MLEIRQNTKDAVRKKIITRKEKAGSIKITEK